MKINVFRVEMLLAKQGLTKTALAERSGLARNNISTIVRRGTCEPKTLHKLAAGLGVDPEELIKEE